MTAVAIEALIKIAIVAGGVMTAVAYLILLERRVAAWIQDRRGPNRVGIPLTDIKLYGLGQPIADGLKFLLKEEYTPANVNRIPYLLAPILIMGAALATFAVIPFGGVLVLGEEWQIPLVVAPQIDVGMIYVFALSGLAVYGVIVGGWASNSKYSLIGGLRASAQIIAYEIPLGLGLLGVILFAGSLRLDEIVHAQAQSGAWYAFKQPLGLLVFFVAGLAEATRLPFDLPECEQELVAGYHTEYTGMGLACFLLSEFVHMITAAVLLVLLFFGGWHFWGITGAATEVGIFGALLRIIVFTVKVMLVILFIMTIRWSWPRFRYDQLMNLAWKVMVPLGTLNLVLVAIWQESTYWEWAQGVPDIAWVLAMWIVTIAAVSAAALSSSAAPKPRTAHPGNIE